MADQTSPHPLTGKQIIVSGAGIAGLSFAISLHKLWPSISSSAPPHITLYERDTCAVPADRKGYSLSLRSDSPSEGIQTLQKMGMLDRMIKVSLASMGHERKEGEVEGGFCIWNVSDGSDEKKKWERVMKVANKTPDGLPVSALRIARADLRRTLVEAVEQLPNVAIHWDSAVTSIQPATDGTNGVVVDLSNGTSHVGDLLIAADGSSSKLRAALRPNDTLQFAGPTCIFGICPIASLHPSGRPTEFGTVISGHGRGLFFAPIDDVKMAWCLSWPVDAPVPPSKLPLLQPEIDLLLKEAREKGLEVYGQRFEKILQASELDSVTRFNAMDKQPFPHVPGFVQNAELKGLEGKVVFLGDANHAVSPFAGNGANLALADGWALAESLVQPVTASSSSPSQDQGFQKMVSEAITKYDALATGRAKMVIKRSHMNIRVMHSSGIETFLWMQFLKVVRWLFFRKVE